MKLLLCGESDKEDFKAILFLWKKNNNGGVWRNKLFFAKLFLT